MDDRDIEAAVLAFHTGGGTPKATHRLLKNVRHNASGPHVLETELPALTEAEFLQLQGNLEALGPDVEYRLEGISWFDDHSIQAYINLLTDIRSRG